MKWSSDMDRLALRTLITRYGPDALILELARRAESKTSSDDPANAAIVQGYASDLRKALRRRDESQALVSYRRDWPTDQWVRWLTSEAEREGLTMASEFAVALTRAGCASPDMPIAWYAHDQQAAAIAERGGQIPSPGEHEQWARYLRAREPEVAKAKSAGDLGWWLVSEGHWGDSLGDAMETLVTYRDLLPDSVRGLIPGKSKKTAIAAARAQDPAAAPDPNDTSMFHSPDGE